MPLENANFISELVESNPPGSDFVLQGDDHLRMLKKVLRQTFPNADRAISNVGAGVVNISGDTALTINHDGFLVVVDTTNQNVIITLPVLGADDEGWKVYIVKNDASDNFVTIQPQTGLIVGEAAIQLRSYFGYAVVHWSGAEWVGALTETGFSRGVAVTASRELEPHELGGTVFATPSGSDLILTLPAMADADGRWAYFKNMSASRLVHIDPAAGETIDGRDRVTLATQFKTVLLLATATGWSILTGGEVEKTSFQVLPFGATIAWDIDLGPSAKLTLAGAATLNFPTNLQAGNSGYLAVEQDATGGHELAFGAGYRFGNGSSAVSLDPLSPTLFIWIALTETVILVARVYTQGATSDGEQTSMRVAAGGAVSSGGVLLKGANAIAVKSSTGVYAITFVDSLGDGNYAIAVTPGVGAGGEELHWWVSSKSAAGFTVNFNRNIEDSNLTQFAPEDVEFSFACFVVE